MLSSKTFKNHPLTLDQLHILDVLEREGSISKAAKSLNRAHSALLYAVGQLESATGVKLLDRSGYRLQLTSFGKNFLQKARELLVLEEQPRP